MKGEAVAPWAVEGRIEAGCDEAGRGCLAGPVVAAAVIVSPEVALRWVQDGGLNDSKKLSATARERLRDTILSEATAWAVAEIGPEEIDRINILEASFAAMRAAVFGLALRPEHLLIDGNRFRSAEGLPGHTCFIGGDGRFASIAAASVLAKTHRDALMCRLHERHPAFGWDRNAGYPTPHHRRILADLGPTPHHRRTFRSTSPDLFSVI